MFFVTLCYSQNGEGDNLQKLEEILENATTDSLKVDAYVALGRFQINRDFNKVEDYISKANHILLNAKYDTRDQRSRLIRQKGILYKRRSQTDKAISCFFESKRIAQELGDSIRVGNDYGNIGGVYKATGEYDKAKYYFNKAIQIFERNSHEYYTGFTTYLLSNCLLDNNELDSVPYFINKAKEIGRRIDSKDILTGLMNTESRYLEAIGEYSEAINIRNRSLELLKEQNKISQLCHAYAMLSNLFLQVDEYNLALEKVNVAIDLAVDNRLKIKEAEAYKIRSEIHKKMDNTELAYADYITYVNLYTEANSSEKVKTIREIELNYEFEKKQFIDSLHFEQQKRTLALQTEKTQVQNRYYLSVLILAILIGFLAIRFFRKRYLTARAQQTLLKEKLSNTSKTNKRKITKLNNDIDQLNNQIKSKRKEVSLLMTESLQHLKRKEKLVVDLKKVAANDRDISLTSVLADLNSESIDDNRLILIKNHLQELNFDFFERLKSKHPELTKVDLEICSYLKLGMGRKEIAKLRYTSLDAVKKTRYRIRKKMELDSNIELEEYLKSI